MSIDLVGHVFMESCKQWTIAKLTRSWEYQAVGSAAASREGTPVSNSWIVWELRRAMASDALSQQWGKFYKSCIAGELNDGEIQAMYARAAHGYDDFTNSSYSNQ